MSGQTSPQLVARIAGVLYALDSAFGPGMYALRKLVVMRDPGTTAANILAHPTMFQLGYAGNLIAVATYIGVTGLFYVLFKPVNRPVSVLAAFLSLAGCIVTAVGTVFYFSPMVLVGGAAASAAFSVAQLQALGIVFIKLYGQFFTLSFVFFGFYCVLIGYLILKSTFLPRILGAGMMLAGLGGLTFIWPPLMHSLYPYMLLGSVGELALTVWMLVFGVNSDRWNEQAAAAASRLL